MNPERHELRHIDLSVTTPILARHTIVVTVDSDARALEVKSSFLARFHLRTVNLARAVEGAGL